MSAPKSAGYVTVDIPDVKVPEFSVPQEALVSVLVVDDEDDFRNTLKKLFEDWGYTVDTAATPDEAISLLQNKNYDMVIADITFDAPQISGDQLITENQNLLKRARIVAITGQGKDRIKRIKELEEIGVVVLEKGGQIGELKRIVTEKLEERKKFMASKLQESLTMAIAEAIREAEKSVLAGERIMLTAPPFSAPAYLLDEVQRTLIDWLKTRENPDRRTILYGNRSYSTSELAAEIERGTEVGREHLEMMVDLFKECLSIK